MFVTRALAIVAVVFCSFVSGAAMAFDKMAFDQMAFDIEAHRGGRALFPENTLVSFASALTMGVSTLELDIGVTKDGAIVVSHERGLNPDLARNADGVYVAPPGTPFVELSLAEVKTYDVGQIRHRQRLRGTVSRSTRLPGTRIPTLSEVFALVRKSGDSHVRLNIETKIDPNHPQQSPGPERFVALLLDLLQAEKFSDRVTIQSFDWRTLQLVQKLAPTIPTVYLTLQKGPGATISLDKASEWTAGFDPAEYGHSLPQTIKAAGGAIWSPYFGDVDAGLISESHRLGLSVVVWTVNKPADIARLIAIGVDGIISDRPDLLRHAAGEAGVALPTGSPVTP
jgi:glycerophosphoryl diester phosphodiesterase